MRPLGPLMPIHLEWSSIALRLLWAAVAGFVIGFDRGEHGRPAGLRTTMLVSLAACVSMIQANALLGTAGKSPDSFVTLDLMRLPLGILTGMGFIGGGAIVRRDNLVLGVTTAASLWFVTVIGLCFGGGQINLGIAGLAIGVVVIIVLRQVEQRIKQDREGPLVVVTAADGLSEREVRAGLSAGDFTLQSCSVVYAPQALTELTCQVRWRGRPSDTRVPEFVRELTRHPSISKVSWTPQSR
jgi:putative Mg2+ transporter-C (MgtC) family protein